MKKHWLLLFLISLVISASSQPAILWQKPLGGSAIDGANSIVHTQEGELIIVGYSFSNDGDLTINKGAMDAWIVKLNEDGDLVWQLVLGGDLYDEAIQVIQVADGSFIVLGNTQSFNEDFVDNHGGFDSWLAKISDSGQLIWKKTIGGPEDESANSIAQLADGNFIITGWTSDSGLSSGAEDVWAVKLNQTGDILWQHTYGGLEADIAQSIAPTNDGGAVIAARTSSVDGDISFNHGRIDYWVIKLNSLGELEWEKTYGGDIDDMAEHIVTTIDGGYLIAGTSNSIDGDITNFLGGADYWVVKLNEYGTIQWEKSYGGSSLDRAYHILERPNGDYILTGISHSDDGDLLLNKGDSDYWAIQTNSSGEIIWQLSLGGSSTEIANGAIIAENENIIIAGYTHSDDGNVSGNHGSRDAWVVRLFFPTSALTGTIHQDPESDCLPDPTEPGLAGWLVKATGNQTFATLTDSLGNFLLPVDTGNYEVTVAPPSPYWDVCNSPTTVSITAFYDTLSLDFPAQAITDCPYLTVDISAPFLRRCFDNNYHVHYCNDGTIAAEDATVEVTLDPYFTYVSSSIPLASQNGNTLTFDLGDVAIGDCGSFQITASLSCDSTILGQTHCTSAHISPDSLCLPPSPLWDGSSIETDVSCNGDSVVFTITNVGTGGMPAPLGFIIIEDQIVLLTDEFQLAPGQSTTVTVPANGSTFRLEAQQAVGHPSGFASTGATIEGCGGWMSLGFFTQWAFDDDPDPFTDVDCQANIGSYDPNDKQGFPTGLGDEHLIEPGQDIEYLIRFQNTGTDTAFKVVIVDVLPPELDLATVRPGASSHPYTYGVTPEGWLTFTFDNIMLPDSNVNEPASHGFVRFRASQVPGLGHGNVIANTALIYFDFNAPVQTNTFKHRIGQVNPWTLVGTTPPVFQQKTRVKVVPNPLTDSALLQVEGIEAGPLRLVLTDVSGKVLRQQTTQGTGFEFQRGELAPGLYFFQIMSNDERIANGKLMVR
ncbi:MAG: DUF11 domain-containing protein [Saprospiraceae bacterium]|nr:DUF11 domain-containing protein [Saprospiraceae bacterium]